MEFVDGGGGILAGAIGAKSEELATHGGRSERVATGGSLVGIDDDRHVLTVAGSRAGKGRSAIVPNLLSYGGGVVALDPKGENANLTASYRAKTLGQKVRILDPFGITHPKLKKYRVSYNPLGRLKVLSRTLIEDAGRIVDSIVVENPNAKDPHWDDSAKALIESLILHVVTFGEAKEGGRDLVAVYDALTGRIDSLATVFKKMMANGALEGRVAAAARFFSKMPKEEFGSVLSTAKRHMKFLDYTSIRSALRDGDFSLDELKGGKVSLYVCLPPASLGSCRGFLRMMVNQTLGTMDSVLERPKVPLLVVLDEFPVLSYMREIEEAAGQIAGYGVKLWFIVQDMGQLRSLYKTRWETFLGNTGMIQIFGNVDNFTLEYVSKKLGNTTIATSSRSAQTRDQVMERGGTGISEQERTTPLLSPSEIASYFSREDEYSRQLLLLPGRRPFVLSRILYDQREPFKSRYSKWDEEGQA